MEDLSIDGSEEESRGNLTFPPNQSFLWAHFAQGQGHLPFVSQARNLRLFANYIQSCKPMLKVCYFFL